MSKKAIVALSILLIIVIAIFAGSRITKKASFSDEILVTLPGCSEFKKQFNDKNNFTEKEFEKLKMLSEQCGTSKSQHLNSSGSPKGVTFEYEFR